MAHKFIIENNIFKAGMVNYHYELADDVEKPIGGGIYFSDDKNKILYLFDNSQQYGCVTIEQIMEADFSGYEYDFENYKIYFSKEDSISKAKENNIYIKTITIE